MIRLIKKWCFLRYLKKDCISHTVQQVPQFALSNQILVSKDAFIEWMAKKSVRRFRWIFLWRTKENQKKLSKRIQEYTSIAASCINIKEIKQKVTNEGMVVILTTSFKSIYG